MTGARPDSLAGNVDERETLSVGASTGEEGVFRVVLGHIRSVNSLSEPEAVVPNPLRNRVRDVYGIQRVGTPSLCLPQSSLLTDLVANTNSALSVLAEDPLRRAHLPVPKSRERRFYRTLE